MTAYEVRISDCSADVCSSDLDWTLVVNDPAAVRNAPEKLFVLDFQQFMPPTLVTRRLEDARAFHAEHGEVVVKPLYGNAGSAVFHIGRKDANLAALVALFGQVWREDRKSTRLNSSH